MIEQHTILEGARFSFVRVAHNVVFRPLGIAAGFPFQTGGKAGTSASAQAGSFDGFDHLEPAQRQRATQYFSRCKCAAENDSVAADIVFDAEKVGWPVSQRRTVANQLHDLLHALVIQVRDGAVH